LRLVCCFFSSRRRHTRFSRDWSSDVCSSDLWPETVAVFQAYKTACVGCAMASFDTIEDVARIYRLDLDDFMQALRDCIDGRAPEIGRASCRERGLSSEVVG